MDPEPGATDGSPDSMAAFGERLLAVIDDGRRTSTYKLALLLALIDCCAEAPGAIPPAGLNVSTRTVAMAVARIYWPQLLTFHIDARRLELRQIAGNAAVILRALGQLRALEPDTRTLDGALERHPTLADEALGSVETTLARYPLLLLQVVDRVPQPFLYDVDWTNGVSLQFLRSSQCRGVRFRPGAAEQLVRLAPLVRPLVESHWVRMVSKFNHLAPGEELLRQHLFGANRTVFPVALRQGLLELQRDACFYCDASLESASSAVDHFIPWSRWPNDAIENLVLAHAACNGHKSDRIPGPAPLRRWAGRLQLRPAALRAIAVGARWDSAPDRTLAVARSLYTHLPSGTPLWNGPEQIVGAHPGDLARILDGPLGR